MLNDNIVRIKDIAAKAGVSAGTVDRVIHKRGGVSERIYKKVMKIIEEMNYEPNLLARALVSSRIYNIAVLVPDFEIDSYWFEPQEGIAKAASDLKQYGIRVKKHIFDPSSIDSFKANASAVTKDKPDGILVSPIFYNESLPFFEKWKKMEIPFVLFNTQIAEFDPLSYIGQDSYQSGLLAGRLIYSSQQVPCTLLIAHIDEEIGNSIHLQKKEKGFRNYFSQNNLSEQFKIISIQMNRLSTAKFADAMDNIIESNPDLAGIFVTTCKAYEVAKYLEQKHINNLKVIGYDLLPSNLYFLDKGRISFLINQNARAQGYWGIYQLTEYLVFKKTVPPIKYLPLDIVARENMNYFLDKERSAFI